VNWLVEHAQGTCSKRTLDEAKKNLGLATQRKGRRKDQIVSWALPAAAEPKEHSAKAASKAKKPAAKTPKAKKPQAKKAAGKKAASKKPASKTLATKTPRATSTKIRLPKASEIYIGE
jgi:histone H1/5